MISVKTSNSHPADYVFYVNMLMGTKAMLNFHTYRTVSHLTSLTVCFTLTHSYLTVALAPLSHLNFTSISDFHQES